MGFVAIKSGEYLEEVITALAQSPLPLSARLLHDYHFGGFAKTTSELIAFKKDFEKLFGFELDYIYTAKMFYGIFDKMKKNYFPENTTIIVIHTGGLQGNMGFEK